MRRAPPKRRPIVVGRKTHRAARSYAVQRHAIREKADSKNAEPAGSAVGKVVFTGTLIVATVLVGIAALLYHQESPLREAEAALNRGDAPLADHLLTLYRSKNAGNTRAMALHGRALVALKREKRDVEQAIQLFTQAGVANATEARAFAHALMIQKQWTDALPLIHRVVQEEPENVDAWYEVASCRFRCGDRAGAIKAAERFAQFPGSEARGYVFVGTLHGELHNLKQATDAFARVLTYEPEAQNLQIPAHEFFIHYGRLLAEANETQAAIENIERGIQAQRAARVPMQAETLELLGNTVNNTGDVARSKQLWREALAIDPMHSEAIEQLAKTLIAENQPQQALDLLEPLMDREDLSAKAAYLIQRAYVMLGNTEMAKLWEKRAEEIRKRESHRSLLDKLALTAPDSKWGRVMVAWHFFEDGNRTQARALLEKVYQEDRNEPFIQQFWETLEDPSKPVPSIYIIPAINH